MSKEEKKDVMSDVINDISAASAEEVEEAQEAIEEVVAEAQEALEEAVEAEQESTPPDAETIVVKFDDELEAAQAVRIINKALRKRKDKIYQGAVVKRAADEVLEVEDFSDMGLGDLVTGTVKIGYDLGRDSVKLVWTTAAAGVGLVTGGIRLLRRTALLATGLGGSTLTMRRRKKLDAYHPPRNVDSSTTDLAPGETAVVIVADRETANELATDLIKTGGELA